MRRGLVAAVAAPVVGVGVLAALVVAGTVAVAGSDTAAATAPASPAPSAEAVARGRPCADPLETQGFRPGPGNLEPNHTGIDFACLGDRTLVALLPGTVVLARNTACGGGYGCTVVVHSTVDGRQLYVRYGHVAAGSIAVAVGQPVTPGTVVGTEGSTGWSTGPHVHVEVDESELSADRCINPTPFLDPGIVTR